MTPTGPRPGPGFGRPAFPSAGALRSTAALGDRSGPVFGVVVWMVHMKKILLLLAVLGGIAFLVQRRRQAAAAEAALWDEATKPTTSGGYPGSTR